MKATSERCFPPLEEIQKKSVDYSDQDYALFRYLNQHLPPEWEIYFEPFFNGNYPDIVILHPKVGLTIFKIKKWMPGEIICLSTQQVDPEGKRPILKRSYYRGSKNPKNKITDPVGEVEHYRENLVSLYCPLIGEEIEKKSSTLAAFKVAIFFQNLTTEQAKELVNVDAKRCIIFGYDALKAEKLSTVVPDFRMNSSQGMYEDWAETIRFWLYPPIHPQDDRQPFALNPQQKKIANPASKKHIKVRGVIGSGKTLVIAHRAAKLAVKGKKVLIITFNITLWHYIKHYLDLYPEQFDWKLIEFHHFHGFCRDYLSENEVPWPTDQETFENFGEANPALIEEKSNSSRQLFQSPEALAATAQRLDQQVPNLVIETIRSGKNRNQRNYDAILIDEGQDIQKEWYQALGCFLGGNDELLIVVDEKQNVYHRHLEWLEAEDVPKLNGPWVELRQCYRMPGQLVAKLNEFGQQFLPDVGIEAEPIQLEFGFFDPNWVWVEVVSFDDALRRIWNCFSFMTYELKISRQDIVLMAPSHKDGWQLVDFFKEKRIDVNHVFEDEKRSHHHKRSFWINDPRLKITTIHSFKGWELANVLLLTPHDGNRESSNLDPLIYTALSRTRQNLVVFNRTRRYQEYGKGWPKLWTFPQKIL